MSPTLIVVLVVVALLLVFVVIGFNRLRRQDVAAEEALGGIDVQLTRRADLIPNLVATVKGYAEHERAVFENVTAARAGVVAAQQSGSVPQRAAAEAVLDQALLQVKAVAEAYPDLQADENFRQLQDELARTEDQLAFARTFYNDAAGQLNTSVRTLPWLLFTGLAGVGKREFYDAPAGSEAPPTVSF